FPGLFRAMLTNARAGGVVQGGSSISQQLAKNLFLSNERTIERKVKEAFLALWLEVRLPKNEILKLYLDRAYLGGGTFGVDAAAQYYFNKSARDVNLAEAAMLAGLFKAPSKFAPHINLPAARARANVVLDNLVEAGFMTEGQVFGARRNPATPVDRRGARDGRRARLRREPVQSRHRRAAPAGLILQALRLCDRADERLQADVDRCRFTRLHRQLVSEKLWRRACRRDDADPGAGAIR